VGITQPPPGPVHVQAWIAPLGTLWKWDPRIASEGWTFLGDTVVDDIAGTLAAAHPGPNDLDWIPEVEPVGPH
jgi:hypothetical protein